MKRSLVEKLPQELLLMILENFCPQSHSRPEQIVVHNLAAVCRKWRATIYDTSAFWVYVTLNPAPSERPFDLPSYLARLVLHLQRTKQALLNISWHINGGELNPQLPHIREKFAPLTRWRSLKLCMTSSWIRSPASEGYTRLRARALIPDLPGTFKNLEELTLCGHSSCSFHFLALVNETALKLRKLEFRGRQVICTKPYLSQAEERVARVKRRCNHSCIP